MPRLCVPRQPEVAPAAEAAQAMELTAEAAASMPLPLVELLRSLAAEEESGANDEESEAEAEGEKAEALRCRPKDVKGYHRRLRTFRPGWWFNKPIGVSPIECARRGWACAGEHRVVCECCGAEVEVTREGSIWLVNKKPCKEAPGSKVLVEGHSPFCPWKCHDVSLADPAQLSDAELVEAASKRAQALRTALTCLPVLAAEEDAQDPCEALGRAGWEPGEESKPDVLQCFYCLRCVAVRSFPHRQITATSPWSRGDNGEPPRKVPYTASIRQIVLPAESSLWTPRPWKGTEGSGGDESEARGFDPHALHRFYCPLYSSASTDLSHLAVRTIQACEAAAAAAERKAANPSFVTERAEGLLRLLHTILPPK